MLIHSLTWGLAFGGLTSMKVREVYDFMLPCGTFCSWQVGVDKYISKTDSDLINLVNLDLFYKLFRTFVILSGKRMSRS